MYERLKSLALQHMNSFIQKTSLTAWKTTAVITQWLKQKYLDFYICIIINYSDFTEAKLLWLKHKVTEFRAFIWVYILTEVQGKLVLTAPRYTPVHNLCRGVPVPRAVSDSRAAHVTPAEMLTGTHEQPVSIRMQRGAQNWAVRSVNQPLRCACLLSDPYALASGLMFHSWGYAWQCICSRGSVWSIPQRAVEIDPLRLNMKPELPTSFSAVSMSQVQLPQLRKKKNLGEILCSLPSFLLELWHLASLMVPAWFRVDSIL